MKKNKQSQKYQPQKRKASEVKKTGYLKNSKENILFIIIIFCVPVLLYLQTLKFGFTNFDDDLIIQNNVKFLSNTGNFFNSFITDQFIDKESSFYRPIGTISYMLDIQLSGGNNPWMYHLSNVLLLGFIACSLYLLLRRFGISPKFALFGTLIFYAHPLFVSTTAHLPNRAELQLSLFSILSFIFLIDFLQKKKNVFLVLHWLAFTIAIFCKETAAFLPFLYIMYYLIFIIKKRTGDFHIEKKYVFILISYGISGLVWFWLRHKALTGVTNSEETFGIEPFLTNLRLIPESLAKFFLPSDIAPMPAFSWFNLIAGSVIIVLLIILFIKNKQRVTGEKIFCIAWFLILLVPSMLYKHPHFDYLDHRFFLPMIGILLFLLFIIPANWINKSQVRFYVLMIFIVIGLSIFSFIKSHSYKDSITFYNAAIAHNTKSAICYNNRGSALATQGMYDQALSDFNKAIELEPDFALAYKNRGVTYNVKGMYKQALDDLKKAIVLKPYFPEAFYYCGVVSSNQGSYDTGIPYYTKAIELNPVYVNAYFNRANLYCIEGSFEKGITDYSQVIALMPDYMQAYLNRGFTYSSLGSYDNAILDFSKVIKLKPDNADAYYERGQVYGKQGFLDKACEDLKKSVDLGSQRAKDIVGNYCK